MNSGRTLIAGPMPYQGKSYSLIVYYDSGYKTYSLQFGEGDVSNWGPVKAAVNFGQGDQALTPRVFLTARVGELNGKIKSAFTENPDTGAPWVAALESLIAQLKLKEVDGVPFVEIPAEIPV